MPLCAANIRSLSYCVARTNFHCRHCARWTPALAVALPPNHEVLIEDEWQAVGANAFLFHVTELPKAARRRLLRLSPHFRLARRTEAANSYWANHCAHCGHVVSDDELHCEPGGFMPSSESEAENIHLFSIPQVFSAVAAGHAPDPMFFGSMRKR